MSLPLGVVEVKGPTENQVGSAVKILDDFDYTANPIIDGEAQDISATFDNGVTVYGLDDLQNYLVALGTAAVITL